MMPLWSALANGLEESQQRGGGRCDAPTWMASMTVLRSTVIFGIAEEGGSQLLEGKELLE